MRKVRHPTDTWLFLRKIPPFGNMMGDMAHGLEPMAPCDRHYGHLAFFLSPAYRPPPPPTTYCTVFMLNK